MKDKLWELVKRWIADADIAAGEGNRFNGGLIMTKQQCADELLEILDAEGDDGAVADSGQVEAERKFFARDFYEEAREGKKAWPGQCDSGRVGDAVVSALDRALEAVNAQLLTEKANERAAWEAVSVLQSHGAIIRAALAAQGQATSPARVPDCVIVLLNHLETLMDEDKLAEDAIPTEMWNAVSMHNLAAAPSAPEGVQIDRARFKKAPCYLCGYNGPGYYQPKTHSCADKYHAAAPKGDGGAE